MENEYFLLEKKLFQISNILKTKYKENDHIGVLAGVSGIAIFNFYYSRLTKKQEYATLGTQILHYCIDKISAGYNYTTYCNGLAGAAWAINHLLQEKFIELEDNDFFSELDVFLYERMVSDIKIDGNYDFLHGAIGYGYYFLTRFKNVGTDTEKMRYKGYILKLVDLLIETSIEETENKVKWQSIINQETKEIGYNLSLSHGMSSIVNFLSRLYAFDDFKNEVYLTLKSSIQYIVDCMDESNQSISLFPNWINNENKRSGSSRVAWCYGDLGIGVSIWKAAKSLGDNHLNDISNKIFTHAAARISTQDSMVKDASICHGSFGNAQIFNFLYRETGDKVYNRAAYFWIQDGLLKGNQSNGYAGYKQWKGRYGGWQNETSLLEGVAGIGLCIISHLAEFNVTWDECIMLS